MSLSNAASVTAVLIIAFGVFVMYTQWKNWFDSNLTVIFYIVFFGFMRSMDGAVPLWLIYIGFGLALILRFEFMNTGFTRVIKFLERSPWVQCSICRAPCSSTFSRRYFCTGSPDVLIGPPSAIERNRVGIAHPPLSASAASAER